MKATPQIRNLLIIAFLLETLCVTYALYLPALAAYTSVLYTFSGLTIGVAFLYTNQTLSAKPRAVFSFQAPLTRYKWLLMGIVLVTMYHFTAKWIDDAPLDFHDADMLPIIKTMCERGLSGHWSKAYDRIPEIWNGIQPIYLPAMWLPFCLPVWLHTDLRWLTMLCLFTGFCIFLWRVHPLHRKAVPVLLCAFLLFWWLFTDDKPGVIPYTEEGLVILYYILLVLAIQSRKVWLIAVCSSLCVLSRYALIGWLPTMLFYYIYRKEWKQLLVFSATGVACFLVLVLLPFGWENFAKHIALPAEYIGFAARVWHDAPHFFKEGLGWARFFGSLRITTLHYLLICLSFLVPLAAMILTLRLQKRYPFSTEGIPLAILKISLVIFYSFIDVPYLYLFYTSSFVSLIGIASWLAMNRADVDTAEPAA